MSVYSKMADAIMNDLYTGTRGGSSNVSISKEQLEDEVRNEFLQVIQEHILQGISPLNELAITIDCIPINCKDMIECPCEDLDCKEPTAHFEIPQFLSGGLLYAGTVDKLTSFTVYTSEIGRKYRGHTRRRRRTIKPYVYVNTTPNRRNMYDAWLFDAPLLEMVSVKIVPKDLRQLEQFGCCPTEDPENYSYIANEVQRRLTEKKFRWYRQYAMPILPNDNAQR